MRERASEGESERVKIHTSNRFIAEGEQDRQWKERWKRGDRRIRDEKEVWGSARMRRRKIQREEEEDDGRERNLSVARTPKLGLSCRASVSYSEAQTLVQYLCK